MPESEILAALRVPDSGTVYELASGWWRGMPVQAAHPSFEVMTYRSPRGERNAGDPPFTPEADNGVEYGYVNELMVGSAHSGTHIDANCHVTVGENDEWHGGVPAHTALGDFGALRDDAAELPPLVARGLLLDVARAHGHEILPAHFPIGPAELTRACEAAAVEVEAGDVVLVRTGHMSHWPDEERMEESYGAGVSLDGARWLLDRGVVAVGADTGALEVRPSGIPGNPLPVHLLLLHEHGVPIMEWVNCEEAASAGVSKCLFLALPLTIRGATGSMIRPIAIA